MEHIVGYGVLGAQEIRLPKGHIADQAPRKPSRSIRDKVKSFHRLHELRFGPVGLYDQGAGIDNQQDLVAG